MDVIVVDIHVHTLTQAPASAHMDVNRVDISVCTHTPTQALAIGVRPWGRTRRRCARVAARMRGWQRSAAPSNRAAAAAATAITAGRRRARSHCGVSCRALCAQQRLRVHLCRTGRARQASQLASTVLQQTSPVTPAASCAGARVRPVRREPAATSAPRPGVR